MSKILKIAGEVVVGAALIVATAGAGAALIAGASIAGAVAGAGAIFAGTIGLTLGSVLAIGAGLTLAGGLLAKKPQVSPSQIDRTNVSLIVDAPRKIVFGHTALATDMRYQEFFGSEQEYVAQVLLLASHWCEFVEQVWLNDVLAWDVTSGTQSAYNGYLFVKYFAQATPASNIDVGNHAWGANAVFTGCATMQLQYRVIGTNDKAGGPFSSSIPTRVTIRGKGARVYDPRLDTSVGGSGSMRVVDQTTWAWASGSLEIGRNPALCMLFYLLGWRIQNPVTGAWKLAVGIGVPVDRIDLGSFMTAANMCDEPVTLAIGGTEPRYRCDGMFSEADDPGTVITAIEGCMNAKLRDSAGRFALQVFYNDLATPVIDLTDDDVLDDFTWDAGGALNDLKNVVKGRYTDPSDTSLYQLVDYPTRSVTSLDGIDRIDSVDQALVQSPGQAQRLANQRLERYQYPGTFTGNFKARAWVLKDGDVVRLTFAALGFATKLFRVAKATVQVTGVVPLVLAEENAAIYAWDASELPAITVAAPNTFDVLMQPIKLAIDDAAETAAWSLVADDNAKRPQDNATRNVPRGAWNGITNYDQGDIVTYLGSSYLAGESVPAGTYPTNAVCWDLLAAQGNTGGPGSPGATGQAGASAFTLVAISNVALTPVRVSGVSTTAPWNGKAYTQQSYTGAAMSGFLTIGSAIGLDVSPTDDASYDTVDYWLYRNGDGNIYRFRNGNAFLMCPDPDASNTGATGPYLVTCDGTTVRYFYKGTQVGSHAPDAPNQTLFGVANVPYPSSFVDQIAFSAAGLAGINGTPGIPGTPGANGQPAFVHVAYADSADGSTNFIAGLANPGRAFIGIYTDANSAGSGDYHAYYWSRLTGQDGAAGGTGTPGPVGANGMPTYVHFAYADAADGSVNFAVGAPGTRKYIGVYSDYTSASSTSYAAYTWSLIKGADGSAGLPGATGNTGNTGGPGSPGANGADAYTVDLSVLAMTVAASYNGTPHTGELPRYSALRVMHGAVDVTSSITISLAASTGITASASGSSVAITAATSSGYVDVTPSYAGLTLATKRIAIAIIFDNAPPSSVSTTSNGININVSATTYDGSGIAPSIVLQTSSSGTVNLDAGGTYRAAIPSGGVSSRITLAAKIQYRIVGAAAWADAAAETIGDEADYFAGDGPSPGAVSPSKSLTGLTAATNYEFRFNARVVSQVNSPATTVIGSQTATQG